MEGRGGRDGCGEPEWKYEDADKESVFGWKRKWALGVEVRAPKSVFGGEGSGGAELKAAVDVMDGVA